MGFLMANNNVYAVCDKKLEEVRNLYWDFVWDDMGKPIYSFDVEEIAAAYGYSSGRGMRCEVDMRTHVEGVKCGDCGNLHVIATRSELREYLDHPRRCASCEKAAFKRKAIRHIAERTRKGVGGGAEFVAYARFGISDDILKPVALAIAKSRDWREWETLQDGQEPWTLYRDDAAAAIKAFAAEVATRR